VKVYTETLTISTSGGAGHGAFTDVTRMVTDAVGRSGISTGLVNVFIEHTSASLLIQENADPRVLGDLARWIARLAPESDAYEHDDEGPDDMPSHLRSAITKTSETIPIRSGALSLGTWQALYLFEHRAAAHRRTLEITVMGA
jgi:secondary thiamine-phosphate synthase enzyme